MDFSLQVTMGESFNYAVCERMAMGVPVLTTEDIYLVADDRKLRKYLCVHASDTPRAIADSIARIVNDAELKKEIGKHCMEVIAKIARKNNECVRNTIIKCYK
jgi:glycosyltransferase involved in cell wall biosynthesis